MASHYFVNNFRWSKIASSLPGRTDNEIKNVWNTRLKKKAMKLGAKKVKASGLKIEYSASPSCTSSTITGSDQNIEKALNDQEFQELEIKKPDELPAPEEIMNITDSFYEPIQEFMYPCENKEFAPWESLEFDLPHFGVVNQEPFPSIEGNIEIPVRSDVDYWELMDSLEPLPEQNGVIQGQEQNGEVQGQDQSNEAEKFDDETDQGDEWLRFVKNIELDLASDNGTLPNKEDQNMYMDLAWYQSMPGSPGNPFGF